MPRLLSRVIAFMGECSFSVYLIHFFVLTVLIPSGFVFRLSDDPRTGAILNATLVLMPLTYALSALTYLVIEKPFLELRRSYLKSVSIAPPAPAAEPEPAMGLVAVAPVTPAVE